MLQNEANNFQTLTTHPSGILSLFVYLFITKKLHQVGNNSFTMLIVLKHFKPWQCINRVKNNEVCWQALACISNFKSYFNPNQLQESIIIASEFWLLLILFLNPVCSDFQCTVHPANSHCSLTIHGTIAVEFLDKQSKQRGKDKDVITSDNLHCLSVIVTTALWYTCHVKPRHPCGFVFACKMSCLCFPVKILACKFDQPNLARWSGIIPQPVKSRFNLLPAFSRLCLCLSPLSVHCIYIADHFSGNLASWRWSSWTSPTNRTSRWPWSCSRMSWRTGATPPACSWRSRPSTEISSLTPAVRCCWPTCGWDACVCAKTRAWR